MNDLEKPANGGQQHADADKQKRKNLTPDEISEKIFELEAEIEEKKEDIRKYRDAYQQNKSSINQYRYKQAEKDLLQLKSDKAEFEGRLERIISRLDDRIDTLKGNLKKGSESPDYQE